MTSKMHFASATTIERHVEDATAALAGQIQHAMQGYAIDLALVFLSHHFTQAAAQVTNTLRKALNPGLMLGCTGEGVIGAELEIEREPGISLVAAYLPDVQLAPFMLRPGDWQTVLNDPDILNQAIAAPSDLKLIVMLADPFSTPIDQVLEAFNTLYGGTPIIGGMASSAQLSTSRSNALLLNDRILTGGAVGVTWSGRFQVDVVVSQGCRPVGHPLTVTAAEHNVITRIEGQPPLVLIQDLVAQLSTDDRALLRSNGLLIGRAIGSPGEELGRGDFLIRAVTGLDRQTGVIAIGDRVHQGDTIQFHLRDAKTAQEDLEMMLLSQAFFEPPRGVLLFTCNGRGTRLYDHPNGDVSTIQSVLGEVPLAGFFCAGEIGPISAANFLHSHTAILALFRPPISS